MIPSRLKQAIAAHDQRIADLSAAKEEIRQAICEWVATAGSRAVSDELEVTRTYVYQLMSGARSWGKFHWKDRT